MILKTILAHLTIVVLVVISGALVDAAASTIHPNVTTATFSRGSAYTINADVQAVTATGIAGPGNLSNSHRAHAPIWDLIVANVGFYNLDGISLSTLHLGHQGSHPPTATIPRRPPCKPKPIAVPEPTFLLLLGMGIGALGLVEYRHKRE
jgi:hypothetical protein